jgi:N-acetylneuraminate synthase/N,N'-diacetyllegionaminate synthase
MKEGETLTETDLIALRPGDGISPMQIDDCIGKKLSKDLNATDQLSFEDLV